MGDKVGENPAALRAAVFLLSAKNRRGGCSNTPPPSRAKVNRLTNVTNYLTDRLDLLKNVVLNDYFASDLESDMVAVFMDLLGTVKEFRKSVMDLETILALAENGILPRSLLPPSRFAEILYGIQKVLPRELALPFDPSDTDQYYSATHTETMRLEGVISVIVNIPLLSVSDQYSVFQIFNIPVPKTFDKQNFVANYEIENAKFVALSEDSLKFMFINDNDFHLYLRRRLPFCPLRRPIMNVLTSTMCIPALLTNRTDNIDLYCEKVIRVNQTTDPTADYLGNGHWIVISTDPVQLEFRCKNDAVVNTTRVVKTVLPLSLVKLDLGCTAYSTHFQLPTHFRTDSQLEPYQIQHLNRTLALNDVWKHVSTSVAETDMPFSHAIKSLPPVPTRTIALSTLKKHIIELKERNRLHYRTVTVPAVSVTTVAVLVALVLIIMKCARCPIVNLCFLTKTPSGPTLPSTGSTVDETQDASRPTMPTTSPTAAQNPDTTISRLHR